jgi:hypothetical protein
MPNGTNKTRIIIATLSSTRRGSCAITRVGSPPISAAVELKTAWRDDTRELVFEPLDGQLMAATAKTGKTGHQERPQPFDVLGEAGCRNLRSRHLGATRDTGWPRSSAGRPAHYSASENGWPSMVRPRNSGGLVYGA